MRFGLPYKGSKNKIAPWIINILPSADVFVDLFCGGGAITHCAMLTNKYKQFVMNDIDGRLPVLFKECVYGKHTIVTHPEWITREEFNAKKDIDAYIALVWSFGNNGRDYIYGKHIEQFKHDYHTAVYKDDTSLLKPYGYNVISSGKSDVYERYLEFNRQIKVQGRNDLESLSRQIEIERLQSLQSLQSLQRHYIDAMQYVNSNFDGNKLIYCDIPYKNTNCGKYGGFNHNEFYEWAEKQDNIFISEYNMPSDFICIASIEKNVLSSANTNALKATEKIFTNQRTINRICDYKQYSIFDCI